MLPHCPTRRTLGRGETDILPNRIVREGILSSAKINRLSTPAELFYRRLINVVDDYGRFYGSPLTIRVACWPATPEKVTDQEVSNGLTECSHGPQPLILRYEVEGLKYIEIQNFGQKVRSKPKFPNPPVNILQADCEQVADILKADCKTSPLTNTNTNTNSEDQEKDVNFREVLAAENGFGEWRKLCEELGISGSPHDWQIAASLWRKSDFEQRKAATDGIEARRGTPDDPVLKALPQNILQYGKYHRKPQGFAKIPQATLTASEKLKLWKESKNGRND